jgi:hypothetical protein
MIGDGEEVAGNREPQREMHDLWSDREEETDLAILEFCSVGEGKVKEGL